MQEIAEFYKGGRGEPSILVFARIGEGHRHETGEMTVADKREARKIAKQRGCVPWNF